MPVRLSPNASPTQKESLHFFLTNPPPSFPLLPAHSGRRHAPRQCGAARGAGCGLRRVPAGHGRHAPRQRRLQRWVLEADYSRFTGEDALSADVSLFPYNPASSPSRRGAHDVCAVVHLAQARLLWRRRPPGADLELCRPSPRPSARLGVSSEAHRAVTRPAPFRPLTASPTQARLRSWMVSNLVGQALAPISDSGRRNVPICGVSPASPIDAPANTSPSPLSRLLQTLPRSAQSSGKRSLAQCPS